MYILASHKLFDFLDMNFGKSLIKSVKNMNKIVHILGGLNTNLATILTMEFTKMQDSYQEF